MNIRGAVPAEAEAMRALAAASDSAAQWNADVYVRMLNEPGRMALVAESGDRICAFIVARVILGDWEIENVVVAAEHRKQGIGATLVRRVIEMARAGAASRLMLEVRESNQAARELYRNAGFVETGRRLRYYAAPEEDAILLMLDLH
jgi:ribosomal-protein-alanine acetyltransferase